MSDVIGTPLVIFDAGRAPTLVRGKRRLTVAGYDDTHDGYAVHPVTRKTVRVYRVGLGLWKQTRT